MNNKEFMEFSYIYSLDTSQECISIINTEYKKANWKRMVKIKLADEYFRIFKNEFNEIITVCNNGIFLNYNLKNDLELIKTVVNLFKKNLFGFDFVDIEYNPIIKKIHISTSDGGWAIVNNKQRNLLKQGKIELEDVWNTSEHEIIEQDFIKNLKTNFNLDFESDAEYNEEFPFIKIGEI